VTAPDPVLALETTQRTGGVALSGAGPDAPVLADRFTPARRHDDRLMPAIDAICRRAGIGPADLGGVAVSLGPGGFSGLRIGLTTAKLLAHTLNIPVVGVPSAEVVAAGTPDIPANARRILVVLAAKREHGWLTRLERTGEGAAWAIAVDPPPRTGDAIDVPWTDLDAVVADEHLPETFRAAAAAARVAIIPPVFDPVACLALGRARLAAGEDDDPMVLSPIYPGPPEAVVRWDALHGPS
jgi:tRNA threonylcarbamoyladenosine biosynthesis protein TsaB